MKAFRRSWLRNVCEKNDTDIASETFRSSRLFCGYQLQKEMIAWLNWKLLFPDILSVFMKVILQILKHRFENYKLNPIQDGSFRDCSWMDGVKKVPLPKICHTCHDETWHSYTLSKEASKIIWITLHTPLVLLTSAFFVISTENQQILLYQEIQIYTAFWNIISNSFNFFESLKISLIKIVTILIMSAKMAILGHLKIKVYLIKVMTP